MLIGKAPNYVDNVINVIPRNHFYAERVADYFGRAVIHLVRAAAMTVLGCGRV